VRGSGKSDREGFYASAIWLHARHPRTLALNAAPLTDFGYLKDLPELLHRIVHGGVSTRTTGKKARLTTKCSRGRGHVCFGNRTRRSRAERATHIGSTEERVAASLERDWGLAAAAVVARRTRRAEAAARAVEMYSKLVTTLSAGTVKSVTPIQSLSYANGTVQTPVS
jgi:hypothetical protein